MPAPSTGKIGIGVVLKMGDGASPQVFATIANCTQVSGGGVTVNMVDATQLDSPDFYSEFKPGLKSADEWTFTIQWDPTSPTHNGTTGLRKKMEDRALTTFRIDPSAIGLSTGIECDAYVSQLGNLEVSPEGIITQQCTLRPSGKPRSITLP